MNVFISYRRDDSESVVHRLHERLCDELDPEAVFLDTKGGIRGGDEWFHKIRERLYQADVLLAVIGRHWLSSENAARLADPGDVLRQELEIALGRGILLVPVLVDGARMPGRDVLPDGLDRLAGKQYVELSNRKFDRDIDDVLDLVRPEFGLDPGGDEPPWTPRSEPREPATAPAMPLGEVLPGMWSQQVTYLNGMTAQATAQFFPNGTFSVQGTSFRGPFAIRGQWSVDAFDQLWMTGQTQTGFQVTPFSTVSQFSHISPTALSGSLSTGERLEWRRPG
ncbi:toll/interleukin-1 receptor domain-containing protein [Rubrivirga sp.]|uniref:toll/interleukin-1 receptor domain-containing protein n=1 Tax=Rubrivirga sp. TaxID=1885344 RepID=UPI003B51DCCC